MPKVLVELEDLEAVLTFRDGTDLYNKAAANLRTVIEGDESEQVVIDPTPIFVDAGDGTYKLADGFNSSHVIQRDFGSNGYKSDFAIFREGEERAELVYQSSMLITGRNGLY